MACWYHGVLNKYWYWYPGGYLSIKKINAEVPFLVRQGLNHRKSRNLGRVLIESLSRNRPEIKLPFITLNSYLFFTIKIIKRALDCLFDELRAEYRDRTYIIKEAPLWCFHTRSTALDSSLCRALIDFFQHTKYACLVSPSWTQSTMYSIVTDALMYDNISVWYDNKFRGNDIWSGRI